MTIKYKYFGTKKFNRAEMNQKKRKKHLLKVEISFFCTQNLEALCAINALWTFNTPSHCSMLPFNFKIS